MLARMRCSDERVMMVDAMDECKPLRLCEGVIDLPKGGEVMMRGW